MHPMIIVGIVLGVILVAALIVIFVVSRRNFECKQCGHTFKISFWRLLFSPYIGTSVYVKCPKCGNVGASPAKQQSNNSETKQE